MATLRVYQYAPGLVAPGGMVPGTHNRHQTRPPAARARLTQASQRIAERLGFALVRRDVLHVIGVEIPS